MHQKLRQNMWRSLAQFLARGLLTSLLAQFGAVQPRLARFRQKLAQINVDSGA